MTIREKYVDVVETIAKREGIRPVGKPPYEIPVSATRSQCLRYALKYVVGPERNHYRYNRYCATLRSALRQRDLPSKMRAAEPLIHIDLGCGPGLFTWVVKDTLRTKSLPLELYGYDHSKEMVRLASDIWAELGDDAYCSWLDDIGELYSTAFAGGPQYSYSLVTFGHVLAQTHNQKSAIEQFADIINQFLAVGCLIVAVDAKSAPKDFRTGCERLNTSLGKLGLQVEVTKLPAQQFAWITK